MPMRVTRGALVAHRYTYAPPRCRTSQYRRTFVLSVSLWNDLAALVFDGVDWRVSSGGPLLFYWPNCSIRTIVFYSFPLSLLPVYRLVLYGWGLRTDRLYITPS